MYIAVNDQDLLFNKNYPFFYWNSYFFFHLADFDMKYVTDELLLAKIQNWVWYKLKMAIFTLYNSNEYINNILIS